MYVYTVLANNISIFIRNNCICVCICFTNTRLLRIPKLRENIVMYSSVYDKIS